LYKVIRRRERPQLLAALDNIMTYKNGQTTEDFAITDISNKQVDSQQDFMEKYDPEPLAPLVIDSNYFKKAYGYSFIIFLFMFVLFYLLIDGNNGFLAYIIINFFLYPFAKVFFDWMGVYKFRQKLEKQKGVTYYFHQLKYFLDAILFYVSMYIAPIGLLFLLIRNIDKKAKSYEKKKNNMGLSSFSVRGWIIFIIGVIVAIYLLPENVLVCRK